MRNGGAPRQAKSTRLGRDMLSRMIYGGRISITIGLIGIPVPPGIGPIQFESPLALYYLVFFFLVLAVFVMHRIVSSLLGRTFVAIRNGEDLAEALGWSAEDGPAASNALGTTPVVTAPARRVNVVAASSKGKRTSTLVAGGT